MSQHRFTTECNGSPISILMGYDYPLDGYFMVIERLSTGTDDVSDDKDHEADEYLYSNLYEVESHPKSLACYQQKLAELNIEVPAQMLEEIIEDRAQRVGNKFVRHSFIDGVYFRQVA